MMAAAHNIKSENPYDYCFHQMSCPLKVVSPAHDCYSLILRYINSGLAESAQNKRAFNVSNIFEVGYKPKTEPALFQNLHQHMMLFHGTSKANLLSILEQGMQIKP